MAKLLLVFIGLTQLSMIYSNVQNECLKEKGISKAELKREYSKFLIDDTNQKIGEYFLCVWEKRQIIRHDGSVDKSQYREFFFQYMCGYHNETLDSKNEEHVLRVLDSIVSYSEKDKVLQAINLINGIKLSLFTLLFNERGVLLTDPFKLFLHLE
ncbi:hypothetical protein FQR65_LT09607 [Abscondita terminalis]|nr:hypothetical protein FQR65_LT09607 [Abscondita terminalis]